MVVTVEEATIIVAVTGEAVLVIEVVTVLVEVDCGAVAVTVAAGTGNFEEQKL